MQDENKQWHSCFSCFMLTIIDDKEPTSTVRLGQNAYNNTSKFGNMSKPKKKDAQESHRDEPTEDPTSELAEAAPVVQKSAVRSVRSAAPPDKHGALSAV